MEEVDEAILKILASSQDRQMDDEEFFGRHIGAVLCCLSPKQKALAKLQIEQVLVNIDKNINLYV